MDIEVAELHFAEMNATFDLPTGWSIDADDEGRLLTCVAEDVYEDGDYAASITIERRTPLVDDEELAPLAERTAQQMQQGYDGFEPLGSEQHGDRVVRTHRFDVPELGRRVHQVQGLVSDVGFYVVNGTTPLVHADTLQPLFEHVIGSLRYAPDQD